MYQPERRNKPIRLSADVEAQLAGAVTPDRNGTREERYAWMRIRQAERQALERSECHKRGAQTRWANRSRA